MHTLFFANDFADDIKAGIKILTLRAPTTTRQPKLRADLALQGLAGLGAARPPRPLHTVVVARARLVLTPTGVIRVLTPEVDAAEANGRRIATLLAGLENSDARSESCLSAFLPAAGFQSYDGLYRHHLARNEAEKRKSPRGRVIRDLIGWGAVR